MKAFVRFLSFLFVYNGRVKIYGVPGPGQSGGEDFFREKKGAKTFVLKKIILIKKIENSRFNFSKCQKGIYDWVK